MRLYGAATFAHFARRTPTFWPYAPAIKSDDHAEMPASLRTVWRASAVRALPDVEREKRRKPRLGIRVIGRKILLHRRIKKGTKRRISDGGNRLAVERDLRPETFDRSSWRIHRVSSEQNQLMTSNLSVI
jgi:hypothetical protein